MLSRRLFLLSAPLTLTAVPVLAGPAIRVSEAYARFLPGGRSGAAFMVIENLSDRDDRLTGVRSDVAAVAELHTHSADGTGMMQMRPIDGGIALPAGGTHALSRGGDHVMLMDLLGKPAQGDTIRLTLTFETAGEVAIDVPVDNLR